MIDLRCGDCLQVMSDIPSGSVDAIICDLPYGTTACKWDTVIPFTPLWEHYKRVIKRNGAIVLFGSQPFTSALVMSNPAMFRYEWIWRKTRPSGSLNCNLAPLREHENILIFSTSPSVYCPQMQPTTRVIEPLRIVNKGGVIGEFPMRTRQFDNKGLAYPRSVLNIPNPNHRMMHPTQKPVALMEYLIRTYTNEGETVLDNCAGSGSTLVGCINTGRNGIGIEKDEGYYRVACERIQEALSQARQLTLAV